MKSGREFELCHIPLNAVHQYSKSQAFYSSLVIEHIVAVSEMAAFDHWQFELQQAASQHVGFVRFDECPSLLCDNEVVKRYFIIHFDSPRHLKTWINSQERKQITRAGQDTFKAYRFKSFTTGLEGWFSQRTAHGEHGGLGPPTWKQILSVVLGLYPLIMLRLKFMPTNGFWADLPLSVVTLLSTLVTSALLSLAVMPFITRWMSFWLYPIYRQPTLKVDGLGLAIICTGLITMSIIFEQI